MKCIPRLSLNFNLKDLLEYGKISEEELNKIEEFLSKKFKVHKIFIVPSARAGFEIILKFIKKKQKNIKSIIFPSYTSPILVRKAINHSFKIRFLEVDDKTLLMVKNNLPKNSVIVPTHIHGNPFPIEETKKCESSLIVEDCAHALISKYKKIFVGSTGDFGVFSISPTKFQMPFRFGMLSVNDEKYVSEIEKILESYTKKVCFICRLLFKSKTFMIKTITNRLIFCLLTQRIIKLCKKINPQLENQLFEDIGIKKKNKLIGLPHLKLLKEYFRRIKDLKKERIKIKRLYERELSDVFYFQEIEKGANPFWCNILAIPKFETNKIVLSKKLMNFNVDVTPNFVKDCKKIFKGKPSRVAQIAEKRGIYLPTELTKDDVKYVCEVMRRVGIVL